MGKTSSHSLLEVSRPYFDPPTKPFLPVTHSFSPPNSSVPATSRLLEAPWRAPPEMQGMGQRL